ncbi:MATE family efflux transporter [Anaerovorax odorimutans]|uniref:MATE family efflux transporter n=1 Tax=Anaerovorax odorimutans TaxID=109327 RepID=UPI0003F5D55F|nr:MATE family efflux transporter [Anaerovorax odorimutans]
MNNSKDTRTLLLTESPFQLMWKLSLPAIIGMVVIGLYNFMDSVFVGQMVGPSAMGAVSISYPFTFINSGIATLVGIGSASLLSRAIGKKDTETINKIMGNLIMLVILFSIFTTIIGIVFTKQLLMLSGTKGEMLIMAEKYLRIVFMGSLFVNFAQSANMIMRGEGLLKRAMMIMGMSAVLNIILDPIMITILKPMGYGVEAAATATLISQVIQAIVTLWYFKKKSNNVKINRIKLDKNMLPPILSVGISAMMMQIMQLIQQTLMYNTAAQYGGESWQIILGAGLRLQAFAFIPLWGISQGFQPAAGTNYGAKDYKRVKQITKAFTIGATALALLFYIPIMCFPKTMLSLFITDADIVLQGSSSLQLLFSTYITLGFMIISITFFQSLGKGSIASFLTMARQIIIFIPLILILPRIGNIGIYGVFFAPIITDVAVLIMSAIFVINEFKKMNLENNISTNLNYNKV